MAYSTEVLADNPWLYWKLGEAAGSSSIADSSGNGRNGIVLNPTAQGLGATSLLNSQTDTSFLNPSTAPYAAPYLNSSDLATLFSGNAVTIEAWVKLSGSNSVTAPRFFGKGGFFLSLGSTSTANRPRFGIGYNGSLTSNLDGPTDLTPGQAYHLVGTASFNGSLITQRLYLNGVEVASRTQAATSLGSTSATKVAVGTGLLDNLNLSTPLPGAGVDEAAIYPTALSASRIQAHYEVGSATLPANTAAPAITGTARVGEALTTGDGTWTGTPSPSYARAWERSDNGTSGWSTISGQTASTYTLTSADAGKYVRSTITASNTAGSASASSAASAQVTWIPANTAAPSFTGTPEVGQLLTGSAGTFTGFPTPDLTYQWQRSSNGTSGWTSISGATSSTYSLTSADAGQHLRLQVTATNTEGSATEVSSAAGPVIWAPANTVLPAITHDGILEVGNPVTASPGTWTGYPTPDLAYQWQRSSDGSTGWASISGATESTYTPTGTDSGKYLRVRVIAESSSGSATVFSAATGYVAADPATVIAPSITGLTRPGQTLTAEVGTWTGFPNPSFGFQWFKSSTGSTGWTALPGKTDPTLMIAGGSMSVGNFYRVEVTGTNEAGSFSAASAAVGPVVAPGGNATAAIVGAIVASGSL